MEGFQYLYNFITCSDVPDFDGLVLRAGKDEVVAVCESG